MQKQLNILEIQGNLTYVGEKKLLDTIKSSIKSETRAILIDLSNLGFVDSAGLATLVRLSKLSHSMGIWLAFCAVPEQLQMLLQMTGLTSFFEIFDTRESFYESWLNQFPPEASVMSLENVPTTTIVAGIA